VIERRRTWREEGVGEGGRGAEVREGEGRKEMDIGGMGEVKRGEVKASGEGGAERKSGVKGEDERRGGGKRKRGEM